MRGARDWSTFEKVGKMKSVTNFSDLLDHARFGISSPTFQYKSAFRILLAAILALEIDFAVLSVAAKRGERSSWAVHVHVHVP